MKHNLLHILRHPSVYLFTGIYFVASFIKSTYGDVIGIEPLLTFIIFCVVLASAIWLITKKVDRNVIIIRHEKKEAVEVIVYFFLWLSIYMVFGRFLMDNKALSVGLGFWGMLVLVPFLILRFKGYTLSDFGITTTAFKSNLKIALLSCLVVGVLLLLMTPGGKFILGSNLSVGQLLVTFAISLGYALVFAALFEEFFFRGVLQTRLTQYFNSDINGILAASVLFGLYHLPFQFYKAGPAEGEIFFALSNTLTEQMISGPIFGILWARTRNLLAPVMLHAFIDAINLVPQIAEKYFI